MNSFYLPPKISIWNKTMFQPLNSLNLAEKVLNVRRVSPKKLQNIPFSIYLRLMQRFKVLITKEQN